MGSNSEFDPASLMSTGVFQQNCNYAGSESAKKLLMLE